MRNTGFTLPIALLAGVLCAFLWAQESDTPFVISDGPLTIDATVPWDRFQVADADGMSKQHPQAEKSVTRVVLTSGGRPRTFKYSKERCMVVVRYARTDIVVTTDATGKALTVRADWNSFGPGASPNLLAHVNPKARISKVTVTRGMHILFDGPVSGGTKVAIGYE